VVTFSISRYRSDALLLTRDGIGSVELPGLDRGILTGQITAFHEALAVTADPNSARADRRPAQARMQQILEWLWDAAAAPVLDALSDEHEPADAEKPRVWWAPGGLLGLLPLHAAGYHTERAAGDQARRTVMDRVVSSYTPTIRALRYARQKAASPSAPGRTLIVAMRATPGGRPLTGVSGETAALLSCLLQPVLLADAVIAGGTGPVPADTPTRANVLAQLPQCTIAHFACHAESDPADPSRSMLMLADHDTAPLTVAALASVNLEHAQLAYLSACRTSITPAATLADEAIHLTSAFQLAGFPHVIGTIWDISDDTAPDVTRAFYANLSGGSGGTPSLETSRAARALHHAVADLRDRHPGTPSLWAAYMHAGA
jgi:hypothetical protein